MPPDRLAELQRQRELVRAHLAWLDQEIAAAMVRAGPPSSPASVSTPIVAPLVESVRVSEVPAADPTQSALSARRGCLLFAVATVALTFLVLGAIYYFGYRDRPLF